MKFDKKKLLITYCTIFISLFLLQTGNVFSQPLVKGKVINIKNGQPVAYANISCGKAKKKAMTDIEGLFTLTLNGILINDSINITSIGYKTLRLPLNDAMLKNEFALYEEVKELQPVILYSKEEAAGSASEITGYFRSWNHHKTGGEIGRIFYIGHNNYKLERVRFKVNNSCDTCLIRLHIREVVDDQPGKEILRDSISTFIHHLDYDDKFCEFDLRPYELILKNKMVFVSFETLHCSQSSTGPCSISYIGTEAGTYIYKSRKNSDWEESREYSIYLKLFYKY